MSQYDQGQVSEDFTMPAQLPGWPKAVGIISIVLASLSLVCGACGLVQNVIAISQGGATMQGANGQSLQLPAPSVAAVAMQTVGTLWAFLLLAAGIYTVRRMPAGRVMHLVYAAVAVLLGVLGLVVGFMDAQRMMTALKQDPQMAQMAGFMTTAMYGALCFGGVLGLGYPVFLLIWFGAVKKRPSDMGVRDEEPVL